MTAMLQAVLPVPHAAAPSAAPEDKPSMRIGDLCRRLRYTVTAEFLAELGFEATVDRGARLFHERDYQPICRAIAAHTLLQAGFTGQATQVSGAIRVGDSSSLPPFAHRVPPFLQPTEEPPVSSNPTAIRLIESEACHLVSFGYDSATSTLAIRFPGRGGSTSNLFHYADVPTELFERMKLAESKYEFFSRYIRGRFVHVLVKEPEGVTFGLTVDQEPKYTSSKKTGRLLNRATGEPIPDDEPLFVLRAKDIHAVPLLHAYLSLVTEVDQVAAVRRRITAFEDFARAHADRMKEPDDAPLVAS